MQATQNQSLPIGHPLQDYVIKKVLSAGGFSVVYLAEDASKNTVAIKEYLPTGLALRSEGSKVQINSAAASTNFKHGLKCFFEEGRALATIEHRNIVRVLNFFRANDTVYMVMQYERGKSLQASILNQPQPLGENFIRRVFCELLNGLREVHARKLLHLDIKPANIYIRLDGSPVLLDFGSARQTLSATQPSLPPSYTPGFASPEQYFDKTLLGPWSDIYSVGASMYACISRGTPPAADARRKEDKLIPATRLGQAHYSRALLEIIDRCLAIDHMQRPQSVLTLQKLLAEQIPSAPPAKAGLMDKLRQYWRPDT
ncbi:serine/threonine protein kinase [Methylovorus menthalis]|uniref:serine/threonine protein kinase n=1 Tax=Methylovorus menthalis TaxID=1002227 RepID=UPI001E318CD0|nr:serine/threonine-protein kinase [Methylovorus menthalis]MCB4810165.1 serine/threonine protein kinase [Methylovorus menthalis]